MIRFFFLADTVFFRGERGDDICGWLCELSRLPGTDCHLKSLKTFLLKRKHQFSFSIRPDPCNFIIQYFCPFSFVHCCQTYFNSQDKLHGGLMDDLPASSKCGSQSLFFFLLKVRNTDKIYLSKSVPAREPQTGRKLKKLPVKNRHEKSPTLTYSVTIKPDI